MADWFTDADLDMAAFAVHDARYRWSGGEEIAFDESLARAALASLAPRIAQERANALREFADHVEATYPEDVFLPDSTSVDARSAACARMVGRQARARADEEARP